VHGGRVGAAVACVSTIRDGGVATHWLLLYILCMSALFLGHGGIVSQYFFPQAPELADAWFSVFTLVSVAFGNHFYQRLFDIGKSSRVLYPLYRVSFWIPLLCVVTVFTGHYVEAVRLAMALVFLLSFVAAWRSYRFWRAGGARPRPRRCCRVAGTFV